MSEQQTNEEHASDTDEVQVTETETEQDQPAGSEDIPEIDELDEDPDEIQEASDFNEREKGLHAQAQRYKDQRNKARGELETVQGQISHLQGQVQTLLQVTGRRADQVADEEELIDPLDAVPDEEFPTAGQLKAHAKYVRAVADRDQRQKEAAEQERVTQYLNQVNDTGLALFGNKFSLALEKAAQTGQMSPDEIRDIAKISSPAKAATEAYNRARTIIGLPKVRISIESETTGSVPVASTTVPQSRNTNLRRTVKDKPRGGQFGLGDMVSRVNNAQTIDELDALIEELPEEDFPG